MIEVISHRGAAGLVPENTLPGFERAIELGADWSECDVHLTRDARLIVMHDDTVDRTTDGSGPVGGLRFDAIRALDAGSGLPVPALAEVLETCRGRICLHLELKGKGTAGPAVRMVKDMGMADQVVFTCFNPDRLAAVKDLDGSLPVSLNVGEPSAKIWESAGRAGAASIGVRWTALTPDMVAEAHRRGLQIGAWNPDTEDEWRAVAGLGLDSICTNHPEGLIPFLREAGLRP